jgi:hypothetical protein
VNSNDRLSGGDMRTASYIIAVIVAVLFLRAGSAQAEKRAYEVACYSGTTHGFVGTIPNIFDTARSAGVCNSVFNACDNNCTGCYVNIDNKQVCFTSSGEVFSD